MKPVHGLLAACAIVLFACTSTSSVKDMNETLGSNYVPSEEEQWAIEQADLSHEEFVEQGLLYRSEQITTFLGRLEGRLLSKQQELQNVISLFILKSPSPNAIALPNGNIYLYAGLFTTIDTEDQLAAITAHEIAHVIQRHTVQAIISQKNKLIGSHIADFATGGLGLVYLGTYASIMNFSREQELEADTEALALLESSGYPQRALLDAFESMEEFPETKYAKHSIYSTHPSFAHRTRELGKVVDIKTVAGQKDANREDEFIRLKAKMMEDSLKIRLRDREFNHALTIVEEAAGFFPDNVKTNFYRGEVHYGFYFFPEISAREYHWIQTGEDEADEATKAKFVNDRTANLATAIEYYKSSIQTDQPYARAFRRLGEIAEIQGQTQQAVYYFETYLNHSPDARDRLYVERALERIGNQ